MMEGEEEGEEERDGGGGGRMRGEARQSPRRELAPESRFLPFTSIILLLIHGGM